MKPILGIALCMCFCMKCVVPSSINWYSSKLSSNFGCDVSDENARFDCMPEDDGSGTEKDCESRGCCWKPNPQRPYVYKKHHSVDGNIDIERTYNVPWCFFPSNYQGYVVKNITETSFGQTLMLSRNTFSSWPKDILTLQMDIYLESSSRLHFKIFDPLVKRYEVPIEVAKSTTKALKTDYSVSIRKAPFGITIRRSSTGSVLFDSAIDTAPLLFADQFIQISTHTGTGLVYGLGEHKSHFLLKPTWAQYSFWAHDGGTPLRTNLYGMHPFFLSLENDGLAHGVFLLNSNAMEVITQPLPALTYRTIGGILDFYIFTGPSPDVVIQQYTDLIGKPFLPPYWALGFHLCRWGYITEANLTAVIKRNRDLGIPYDVQWNDLDYMDSKLDWAYDRNTYPHLPDIVKDLHDYGMKYIMIVDPGISVSRPGNYSPYDEGIQDGIFVLNATGQPLIGTVWPGTTVFPDWTHPKVADWWYKQAKRYHDEVPYDGLWIDMNEPSNFKTGSTVGCTTNNLDKPPYLPGIAGEKLEASTICASAKQYQSSHYNLHNLYGHGEAIATHKALSKILGKRSIIISRSTFVSTGRWAGHWNGDNLAIWDDMFYSIPLILSFQMFGISLVGADICGFGGNSNEELCIRWTQLGAFYPFMRNHNDFSERDQDPASWSPAAQKIMKQALELRYALLPYFYSLFVRNHQTGSTLVRPLFFEFVQDENTYSIDTQFLWGSALLISPALNHNQTVVNAYFPRGLWYDIYDGSCIKSSGSSVNLDSPLEKINVHVRGGYIVPTQKPAVTTTLARKNPFQLIVALDGSANGELIWDDGETLDSTELGLYNEISFSANQDGLSSKIVRNGYKSDMILDTLWVIGLLRGPSTVTVGGKSVSFSYRADAHELIVSGLNVNLLQPLVVSWPSSIIEIV